MFLVALMIADDFIRSVVEASTLASLAIIAFFVPNFSVRFLDSIDETFYRWIFNITSFVFVVDSMSSWEPTQEWNDDDWIDPDGTLIVAIVTIASTAKTESTLGIRGGVRDRPFLVDWIVFDGKFEFSKVESDISTLFGGRVTGFVGDMVFGSKIEDFESVLGKDKVVGENVDITINIISNSKRFDLVLKINNDFEVVVTSIMSDSVFASVSLGQVESFTVIGLNNILVGSGTLTRAFTANVTSTAFTVFLAWWNVSSFLTVWTVWSLDGTSDWVTSQVSFGNTFAFLASVRNMWNHVSTWSIDLTVVFTTASFFFVFWAARFRFNFDEFDTVDTFVSASWWSAKNWFTSANWFWATFTVAVPFEFVTFTLTSDSRVFKDGWFITGGWIADTRARVATSTGFSSGRSNMSEFTTGKVGASITTWSLSTFDGSDLGVFGFDTFASVATFSPDSTTTVGFFGQWIFAVLLVDFASFTASSWHDHSGVTFTASDLGAWFLEALFETVDTLAGITRFLPDVSGWNQTTVDFTWTVGRFNHLFSVAE